MAKSSSLTRTGHSLVSLSSRLSTEINNLEPGDMLSADLKRELDVLPLEVMELVSDRLSQYQSPLTVACSKGLTKVVKYLCQKASPDLSRQRVVDPYAPSQRKAPLLWMAVANKNLSMVDILLNQGADIDAITSTGCTPLSSACWLGWNDVVVHLLHRGANVNKLNKNGSTCLMNAVTNLSLCKILLRHGVDIYARDLHKKTVLNYAIEKNLVETVEFLLGNNICRYEIDSADAYGLLIYAVMSGPNMYFRLRFLHNYLSPPEEANVAELIGCVQSTMRSRILSWLYAADIRRKYKVRKVINPPKAVFGYKTEFVSAKQIKYLSYSVHFTSQIFMVLIRILGPHDGNVIDLLGSYLKYCSEEAYYYEYNKLCFLFLELRIERHGFLSETVTQTSQLLVENLEHVYSAILRYLKFDVLFETLQLIASLLQANRVHIMEFPDELMQNFNWNLTFLLILIHLTHSLHKTAKQAKKLCRFIKKDVLNNGETDRQLRTYFSGRTLLHLAVSSCPFPSLSDREQLEPVGSSILPNISLTELLLDCGAPINLADSAGFSPLFAAVSARNPNIEVAELLVSRSAHLEKVGPNGSIVMDVRKQLPSHILHQLDLSPVPSLRCMSAMALANTCIKEDFIPPGLRTFVKIHTR